MPIHDTIPKKFLSQDFIEKINQIYHDLEAEDYEKSHPEIFRREQARWKSLLAATKFNNDQEIAVLDVGTGTGFAAYQILSKFSNANVKCVDISEKMLRLTEERLTRAFPNSKIIFELNSADRIESLPNTYDLITMNSVLHHLPEPFSVLQKFAKYLAVGGFIILGHEPNYRFFSNNSLINWAKRMQRLRSFLLKYFNPPHYINKLLRMFRILPPIQTQCLALKTFAELKRKGFIKENDHFKSSWIGALVDLHIPRIKSGIKSGSSGFNFHDLESKISSCVTVELILDYDFLLDESYRSLFHMLLNFLLSLRYPGCGAHFAAVIKRCS